MATNYGKNAAAAIAVPFEAIEQSEVNGRIHVQYDEFPITAVFAANDTIVMGAPLPAGARVMSVLLDCPDIDTSSNATISSGWLASAEATPLEAANATGFLAAQDVHTAALAASMTSAVCGTVGNAGYGKFHKFLSSVQPVLTVAAGPSTATTGTIRQTIHYTFD